MSLTPVSRSDDGVIFTGSGICDYVLGHTRCRNLTHTSDGPPAVLRKYF